jgi:membrane protein YqaA with SNARE-associated domain
MSFRQHIEEMTATVGGVAFAAFHGFLGDLVKVACAATVSALAGAAAKWVIAKVGDAWKARKLAGNNSQKRNKA